MSASWLALLRNSQSVDRRLQCFQIEVSASGQGLGLRLGEVEESGLDCGDLSGQIGRVDPLDPDGEARELVTVEDAGLPQPLLRRLRRVV
ncbi:hypothetical protein, partial [Janibacter corallicola]|uniref:hypothetical protein n=1 Tax=Janibacter corallicola TaxID=415212 RepID=UPI001C3F18CD